MKQTTTPKQLNRTIRNLAVAIIVGGLFSLGRAYASDSDPLTNDSIVKMVKAGISDDTLVDMIKHQSSKFDISVDGVLALKSNNVSDKVIHEMVSAGTNIRSNETAKAVVKSAVKEPEFAGVFFRVENGDLISLERQESQIKGQASGFIVKSAKVVMQFDGEKSPVRFKTNESLEFVVKLDSQNDPVSQIEFYQYESVKGKRQRLMTKATAAPYYGAHTQSVQQTGIPFNATKYGESSFKITCDAPLAPGEYALNVKALNFGYKGSSFCFGVDADAGASNTNNAVK